MTITIKGGTLIDGTGKGPLDNPVIVIKDGKIDFIRHSEGIDPLPCRETIDLTGKTILPGLIDTHTHVTMNYLLQPDSMAYNDARLALLGAKNLQTLLDAGITTIRDVGSQNEVIFGLKKAVQQKLIKGPRIVASGQLICSTVGHGTEIAGSRLSLVADGEDGVRKVVREQFISGADFIKITIPIREDFLGFEHILGFNQEELDTIIGETHRLKKRVAAHAIFPPHIRVAVSSGVDSLEHGWFLDPESVEIMATKGIYWVPTIVFTTSHYREAQIEKLGEANPIAMRLKENVPLFEKCFASLRNIFKGATEAGVRIATGTDVLDFSICTAADEAIIMTELGYSCMQSIMAATKVAAEVLDMKEQIGTVEKGKSADILVLNGNPLSDINSLKDVYMVMKEGEIVHRETVYNGLKQEERG